MAFITISLSQQQVLQLVDGQDILINLRYVNPQPVPDGLFGPEPEDRVKSGDSCLTFLEFFNRQIRRLLANGSLRTTETYRAAYRKFVNFRQQQDLPFSAFDSNLMEAFQSFLRHQDLSLNTISFYMRILRSVYHKAVEEGLTVDHKPFVHVYTGQAKTMKRAISVKDIRRIKELNTDDNAARLACDLFLFSFYTRGMSFVDMAYLQQTDIRDGVLTYKRRKTGQTLHIRWEKEMQEIVDRWQSPRADNPYLLPIISKQNGKERNQYRHIQTQVNKQLKTVAEMVGMTTKLTMYCARHSWATIARQLQIPMEVISHGMGHTHERTTEIYLKSIDCQTIDQANRLIMGQLQDVQEKT